MVLKTSKKVYGVMFFGMLKYVYPESLFNTIYIDKTQVLKRFPSDKINGTKYPLFFLATHHSFTFNLRFLYELKHKIRVSKTVRGIFHDFKRDFKRHNSLQN